MQRHFPRGLSVASLAVMLVMAVVGCSPGGARSVTAGMDAAPWQLPAPAEVLRQSAATEAERTRQGSDYLADAGLHNLVEPDPVAHTVTFKPDYTPLPYPPFSGVAYCIYRFHVPDYNDTPEVVYYFSEPPAQWDTAYIGLGDFTRGTWRWFKCTSYPKLSVASLAPYISSPGEEMVIAVVAIGTQELVLDYLRVGDNSAPIASFTAEPSTGPAPLSVHFDGSGSSDYFGSIVDYEWDPEGDGTFETAGAALSATDFTYNTAGIYNAALRVTDPYGLTNTATVPVNATTEPSGTWHSTMADGGNEETGWYPTLLEVQGCPAVSYLDHKNTSTNGVVRYIRATDAQGTAWGAPVLLGECGEGGGHVSMALIEGKPAVAYGDAITRQFVFCTATDANGDAWGAPLKIADDTGVWLGFTALAVVDGNPAVAFADTGGHVHYSPRARRRGASWPATDVTIDPGTNAIDGAQLLVSGGVPLLFYNCDLWREVRLARATTHRVRRGTRRRRCSRTEMGTFSSAALVDGEPALAYVEGGNLDLYFMRASDAQAWHGTPRCKYLRSPPPNGATRAWPSSRASPPSHTWTSPTASCCMSARMDSAGAAWGEPMVIDNHWFDTTGWYSSLNTIAGLPAGGVLQRHPGRTDVRRDVLA